MLTQIAIEAGGVFLGGAIIGGVCLGAYHRLDVERHLPLWVDTIAGVVVLLCAAGAGFYVSPDLHSVGDRVCVVVASLGALMGPSVFPVLRSRMLRGLESGKVPGS